MWPQWGQVCCRSPSFQGLKTAVQLGHRIGAMPGRAGTAGPCGRLSPFGRDLNDGVVAVSEVPIRADDRPQPFPVLHSLMMYNRTVQQAVVAAMMSDRV